MITGSALYCFSIITQLSGAGWSLLLVKTTPPGKQTPVCSERGLDVMWGAFLIGGIAALWSWCVIVMNKCCWPQEDRESSELCDLCRFCWGGVGGCSCGKTWICVSDVKTGWVSMIFMRRQWPWRVCAGGLGGLEPQKKVKGAGGDLVHSHPPERHWRPCRPEEMDSIR